MPYRTQYGKHYHETYGCHGATIPCGTEGLTPCSNCCGAGHGTGGGTPSHGNATGGAPHITAGSGNASDGEGWGTSSAATVSESDFRRTFWGTSYAYVGRDGGMDRPFRIDVSSAGDGGLYWQMTAAYSQIDDALVPIGSSFADDLGDIYIPPAGEWEPKLPRVSEDGTRVGPTFRTMEEALADVNATIARLGITDDTESIAWCSEHPSFLPPSYASVVRSSEATEIGIQAMSDGMPLAGGMTVGSIAETLEAGRVPIDGSKVAPEEGKPRPWNRDDAYRDADLTESARRQLRQGVGYRSDALFGEGYTDAASVLTHETFSMGNTDIIDTLSSTVLAGTDVGRKLEHISAVMSGRESDPELEPFLNRAGYDDCDPEGVTMFRDEILPAIREATGYEVNHVLWLCDSTDQVIDSYGDVSDVEEDDISEYDIGGVLLSDIGIDGVLWGYTDPIEREEGWGWW